jgi:hypothetical protein
MGISEGVLGTDELRARLTGLLEDLASGESAVVVGRQRRPEAVLVSWAWWRRLQGEGPVLGNLGDLGPLDHQEGLDLEVAQSALGLLIAWYSGAANQERAKAEPDLVRVSECEALAGFFVRERRALTIRDRAGVKRVLKEYGPLAKRLYHADRDRS